MPSPFVRLRSDLLILTQHPAWKNSPLQVIMRMIRWFWHILTGIPARARFSRWGFDLHFPAKRRGGSTAPFLFMEYYEPELIFLEHIVQPGMTVIDGGANTGIFAFVAATFVGTTGKVIGYEPGKEYFEAMKKSASYNNFPQVELKMEALSDKTEKIRFYHHLESENAYGLGKEEDQHDVPYDVLDAVALDDILETADIIKLDICGAEEFALKGSERLLETSHPFVLFEIDPMSTERLGVDPLGPVYLLQKYGYQFFCLDDNMSLYPLTEYEGIRHIVAIHPSRQLGKKINIVHDFTQDALERFSHY